MKGKRIRKPNVGREKKTQTDQAPILICIYIKLYKKKKFFCLFTLAHGRPNLHKFSKFDGVLFSFETHKKKLLLHNLWLGNRFAFHSFVKFVPQGKKSIFFRHITKNLQETNWLLDTGSANRLNAVCRRCCQPFWDFFYFFCVHVNVLFYEPFWHMPTTSIGAGNTELLFRVWMCKPQHGFVGVFFVKREKMRKFEIEMIRWLI